MFLPQGERWTPVAANPSLGNVVTKDVGEVEERSHRRVAP